MFLKALVCVCSFRSRRLAKRTNRVEAGESTLEAGTNQAINARKTKKALFKTELQEIDWGRPVKIKPPAIDKQHAAYLNGRRYYLLDGSFEKVTRCNPLLKTMIDWTKTYRSKKNVAQLNANLAKSLAHCLPLNVAGWNFQCVECHIAEGTYPSGHLSEWHSHNEYQIEIALSGAFAFDTEDSEKTVLRPGHVLLIPWKHPHRWKCSKPGVMIGISLKLLPTPESIRKNGWLFSGIKKLGNAAIKLRAYDLIRSGMGAGDPELNSKINASHLFLLLAAIMEPLMPVNANAVNPGLKGAEARGRDIIGQAVHLLDTNLAADINLKQVAREAGLSTRQVHRLFLKHVGKSLHDYLLERRLEEARKLITAKNQKLQIKEIAFSCGFNSLSYFCTAFKRIYGVVPSSLLLPDVSLKSGTTFRFYRGLGATQPVPLAIRKRAPASAARKARG